MKSDYVKKNMPYRGRFAPSPTGPLHFGSLVAAVGSYLDAKINCGVWLVRIDDLDTPRVVPGAADNILRTLDALGMLWHGKTLYQSTRIEAYRAELDHLRARNLIYSCACTRREIADSAVSGIDGYVYPGTCRDGLPPGKLTRAWRVDVRGSGIVFDDTIQGHRSQDIEREIGDFVLLRADGIYAYQLATVVDDASQGITNVVRGADLIDSTPRQIYLQRLLNLTTPRFAHLPVAANDKGEKLSKQTRAPTVDITRPAQELVKVMKFLGFAIPNELAHATTSCVWEWCIEHWSLKHVLPIRSTRIPT